MGPSFAGPPKLWYGPACLMLRPAFSPPANSISCSGKTEERGKNNRNKNIRNFKIKLLPQFDGSEQNLNRRFITTRSNIFKKKFV